MGSRRLCGGAVLVEELEVDAFFIPVSFTGVEWWIGLSFWLELQRSVSYWVALVFGKIWLL